MNDKIRDLLTAFVVVYVCVVFCYVIIMVTKHLIYEGENKSALMECIETPVEERIETLESYHE